MPYTITLAVVSLALWAFNLGYDSNRLLIALIAVIVIDLIFNYAPLPAPFKRA